MSSREGKISRSQSTGLQSHPSGERFFSLRSHARPTVGGSGLIALDVLVSSPDDSYVQSWAGGSCANVLTILSYLGWSSHPIGRLGTDWSAQEVQEDLAKWGVRLKLLQSDPTGSTPIVLERIVKDGRGGSRHSFDWRCPRCMSWFPRYTAVKLSVVDTVLSSIADPDVYYFDKLAPAVIELAKRYRDNGALVVFEPNGVSNARLFKRALDVCHVLKYSNERMGNKADILSNGTPILQIETLGPEGLRYQFKRDSWRCLKAFELPAVEDESGAGDWVSAGLIHVLGREGEAFLKSCKRQQVEAALQFGQSLAAVNCLFDGARGAMYALDRPDLEARSISLLEDTQSMSQAPGGSSNATNPGSDSIYGKICPGCKS